MSPSADHRRAVAWGALTAAFLVAQQIAGKAARDAFFLGYHPASALPAVTMVSALLAVAAAFGAGRLLARRGPRRAVPVLVSLHAALLLAGFVLARVTPAWAAVAVYVEIAASGAILLSGFWSIVNERFDPWTAKRVMGRLALGASLGGVGGGALAWSLSGVVTVQAMLVATAALNVLALVGLVRFGGDVPRTAVTEPPRGAASLRTVPYLRLLAAVVALGAGAEALLDYVFKARAAATLTSPPELLAFFAGFHTSLGLLSLAGQVVLVRSSLERLGLAGTVALRPLAVVLSAILGVLDPRLWTAALGRGTHDVLSNSLFRSGYELLYTPLPDAEKRGVKPVVDGAVEKVGLLLGGLLTLAAVRLLATPEATLLAGAGAFSLAALALTPRLHRGYVAALEESLRAGRIRLEAAEIVDSTTRYTVTQTRSAALAGVAGDEGTRRVAMDAGAVLAGDPLLAAIADLRSGEATRIARAAASEDVGPPLVPHLVALLGRNDVYLDVLRALKRSLPRASGQILDALLDPETAPSVRRRLARVLKAAPSSRVAEGLLLGLRDPRFDVRVACSQALSAVLTRRPELKVDVETVWAAARHELRAGAVTGGEEEAPDVPRRLDHVFDLLSLVLEPEPLQIAARALRGDDPALAGTALEYLDNVLPRDLHAALVRTVGAAPPGPGGGGDALAALLASAGPTIRSRRRRVKTPD